MSSWQRWIRPEEDLVDSAQELIMRSSCPALYCNSYWASNDLVRFYFTYGGVGSGCLAINKMAFV